MNFTHKETVKLPNGTLVYLRYDAQGKIIEKRKPQQISKQNPNRFKSLLQKQKGE